jgi:hypothetical protein
MVMLKLKYNAFIKSYAAFYENDLHKCRSTIGYAICLAGGAVVYCSKTQTVTAPFSNNYRHTNFSQFIFIAA